MRLRLIRNIGVNFKKQILELFASIYFKEIVDKNLKRINKFFSIMGDNNRQIFLLQ